MRNVTPVSIRVASRELIIRYVHQGRMVNRLCLRFFRKGVLDWAYGTSYGFRMDNVPAYARTAVARAYHRGYTEHPKCVLPPV